MTYPTEAIAQTEYAVFLKLYYGGAETETRAQVERVHNGFKVAVMHRATGVFLTYL